MTRKDYELIARAFATVRPSHAKADTDKRQQWNLAVVTMTDALYNENSRFDGQRFLSACGF